MAAQPIATRSSMRLLVGTQHVDMFPSVVRLPGIVSGTNIYALQATIADTHISQLCNTLFLEVKGHAIVWSRLS